MTKPPMTRPALSSAEQALAARRLAVTHRYRRSQVLGLLLVAAAILAATLLRADPHTLFPAGWWRF